MYHDVGVYSVNFGILSDRSGVLTGTDGADRLSLLLVDQKPRRHGCHVREFLGIWKNIVKKIERATAGGPCSSGNVYIYIFILYIHTLYIYIYIIYIYIYIYVCKVFCETISHINPLSLGATRPWIPSSAQVAIEQLASPQTFAPYMGVSENSVPLNTMVNDHYPY